MLMLPASIFVSILVFISSYLPPVSAACLPCKFQRPNFWQRWTLHVHDPRATPIRVFNPSYRSVWFFGEWQLVTWYFVSLSMLIAFLSVKTAGTRRIWIYLQALQNARCTLHNGTGLPRIIKKYFWVIWLRHFVLYDHLIASRQSLGYRL